MLLLVCPSSFYDTWYSHNSRLMNHTDAHWNPALCYLWNFSQCFDIHHHINFMNNLCFQRKESISSNILLMNMYINNKSFIFKYKCGTWKRKGQLLFLVLPRICYLFCLPWKREVQHSILQAKDCRLRVTLTYRHVQL